MGDNIAALCPENYPPPFGWLSPRLSLSRDLPNNDPSQMAAPSPPTVDPTDPSDGDFIDFEFPLDYPVAMLSADELFSNGKLVPLQISAAKWPAAGASEESVASAIWSRESTVIRRMAEVSMSDPYVFSPRAPSCTSRWRELLGLKRAQGGKQEPEKSVAAAGAISTGTSPYRRSLKNLLHWNPKTVGPSDGSVRLPLFRDSDTETLSLSSSRLSLSSSSSSGPDHEDIPRLSLDSEKQNRSQGRNLISLGRNSPLRVRLVRTRPAANNPPPAASRAGRSPARRTAEVAQPPRGASVDSPRMNSSGKVVFYGLERSSSSSSNYTAGGGSHRLRARGMERSYSSNVRVVPVLNVPVYSLRGSAKSTSVLGLGQLFSPQKKEKDNPAQSVYASSARSASTRTKIDRQDGRGPLGVDGGSLVLPGHPSRPITRRLAFQDRIMSFCV